MKNYDGGPDQVNIVAPSGGTTSGVGVLTGQIFGVATRTALEGETVAVVVLGKVTLAKTSALAIDAGDALYWDDTAKVVNKDSAAQKEVGFALEDAANPSGTVLAYIFPTARASVAA